MNEGKRLEDNYKFSCEKENIFNYRLYDTSAGRMGVANVCDFISFDSTSLLLCECKATKEKSLPWDNISKTQWEMIDYVNPSKNIYGGFLIYFYAAEELFFLPVEVADSLRANIPDKKSVSISQLHALCNENKAYRVGYYKPRVNIIIYVRDIFNWLRSEYNE